MNIEHNDNAQWKIPHNSLPTFQLLIEVLISDTICFNPLRWLLAFFKKKKTLFKYQKRCAQFYLEILANAHVSDSERHLSLEISQTWDYFQFIPLLFWVIEEFPTNLILT